MAALSLPATRPRHANVLHQNRQNTPAVMFV
jgi:hypothetical protein